MMKLYSVCVILLIFGCSVVHIVGEQTSEEVKDPKVDDKSPPPVADPVKPVEVITTTTIKATVATTVTPTVTKTNCSSGSENGTCNDTGYFSGLKDTFNQNKGMIQRTFYVLIGVTFLIVAYFVVKTVRLRQRRSKSRKYGVISTRGQDNLEMTPLDQDDDDEDMTVFEINGHPK